MNFIEASRNLVCGKKIRLGFWGEGKYLQKTSFLNYVLLNELGKEYQIQIIDVLRDDWEIYEEQPKLHTFNEALIYFKEGKYIRRKIHNDYLRFHKDGYCEFGAIDVMANDWIIIDKEETK